MEKLAPRPDSLLKWINTFHVQECTSLEALCDGVTIAKVLHQIIPDWFTQEWLNSININGPQNWRLKVSNLKKILEKVMDYYQDVLGFQLTSMNEINISKIAENDDINNLTHLLQLVLGCAIHCPNKGVFISNIMDMEEDVQQAIKTSIQDLERFLQEFSASSVTALDSPIAADSLRSLMLQLNEVKDELRKITTERDEMAQHCHELETQVVLLQDERASLQTENKTLHDKVSATDGFEEPSTGGLKYNKEIKKQIDLCKEELFKAETARDDYCAKVRQMEKELVEMQARQIELQQTNEESRHLKDELDILREAADKAAKHESTIESYKKKMEEFSDLKRHCKILEDKKLEYMQSNMELEEEIKKSGSYKPQIEMYKKQLAELHQQLAEESKRADKIDFDNRKLTEKLQAVKKEKERLVFECDRLKENVEELKFSRLSEANTNVPGAPRSSTTDQVDPLNLKEKVRELEHENNLLRIRNSIDESTTLLQAQLEDLNQRICLEQANNRRANQRVLELENQMSEAHERLSSMQTEKNGDDQRMGSSTKLQELENIVTEYKTKVAVLQETLAHKEAEIQAKDEKYNKCIDKAKSVIQSLDPKCSGAPSQLSELHNQLQEKEHRLATLEEEIEKKRGTRQMEENLMITAFNKFATQLQRQAAEKRLSHMSSYLYRQRQPTSRSTVNCSSISAFNTSDGYVDY